MSIPKKKPVSAASVMDELMTSAQSPEPPVDAIPTEERMAPEVPVKPSEYLVPPVTGPLTRGMDTEEFPPAGRRPLGRPTIFHEGDLVKKGYYLPRELVEALRIRQFNEPELSLSNHVTIALRRYLGLD